MMRRSTAREGDAILITGYPGEAAAGLQLLLQGKAGDDWRDNPLIKAFNTPSHRAREGAAVAASGYATAMIDTSDGFLGDLGHICEKSGTGAELIQADLPISEPLREAALQMKQDPYDFVLGESDDYELIITCPVGKVDGIRSAVAAVSEVPVAEVGRITEATHGIKLMQPDGTERTVTPAGWDHFSK